MRTFAALILFLNLAATAIADDWPQYMGPQRDNVWRETGIVKELPAAGPKVVWRVPVAGGYAGPSIAAGKVYIADYVTTDNVKVANFERKESSGTERVLCLDEATGNEIWHHEYPVKYTVSYPAGPRCVPNVHDGKVYTLGAEGDLLCLDAATGKVIWSKNLPQEYHTKTALWGYAGHPLIDGKKLIVIAGGEGSFVVAFDKDTGAELWRGLTSPEQGYASPEIIEHGGKRQLILLRPDAVTSLDPETGHEYWSTPYKSDANLVSMCPDLVARQPVCRQLSEPERTLQARRRRHLCRNSLDGRHAARALAGHRAAAARGRHPLRLRPQRQIHRHETRNRRPAVDHDRARKQAAGQQRHSLPRPPGRPLLALHRKWRSRSGPPLAGEIRRTGPRPHPRAHERRLRPPRRLVPAGLCERQNVRPQRHGMRLCFTEG